MNMDPYREEFAAAQVKHWLESIEEHLIPGKRVFTFSPSRWNVTMVSAIL